MGSLHDCKSGMDVNYPWNIVLHLNDLDYLQILDSVSHWSSSALTQIKAIGMITKISSAPLSALSKEITGL